MAIPTALTIAGSDPSGGAGIQADLKSFHQRGVYGMSVITLITVQNTRRVTAVRVLPASLVIAQLKSVLADIPPRAAKTGALGSQANIEAIASLASKFKFPLVVDPVMGAKSGASLLNAGAAKILSEKLLPHAVLVTPNMDEAAVLSGRPFRGRRSIRDMAEAIADSGVKAVLIKGGHLPGKATDYLLLGGKFYQFDGPRIRTPHTHGTGCTLSAVVTAELAKGRDLLTAVGTAKRFIDKAIRTHPPVGHGRGPVNHFVRV